MIKLTNESFLTVVALVGLAIVAQMPFMASNASAGVGTWSITRAGSSIGLDSTGQINLVPVAGKGTKVGTGGAPVKKILSGTASVDFTALAAGTCENFTITVTGAADGDSVSLGIPAAAWATTEYATIEGFVSAANTVTVKRCNLTNATTALSNPATVTIRATVFQF
jgi:hypothetical protein